MEAQRDADLICKLQQTIETLKTELGSAHKALKGQSREHAAELEGVQELYGSQLDAAQEQLALAEIQCEEQQVVVKRSEEEVVLLQKEKAFCLQLLHEVKSESRRKVSTQRDRAAEARARAIDKGKELVETKMQLAQSKLEKIASRKKFVTKGRAGNASRLPPLGCQDLAGHLRLDRDDGGARAGELSRACVGSRDRGTHRTQPQQG